MRDEILIGEKVSGDSSWSGDSQTLAGGMGIMFSRSSFLVDGRFLGFHGQTRIRINRRSPEGVELTRLLEENCLSGVLRTYLTELYLRHVNPKDFLDMLNDARATAEAEGVEKQKQKVKRALGLS